MNLSSLLQQLTLAVALCASAWAYCTLNLMQPIALGSQEKIDLPPLASIKPEIINLLLLGQKQLYDDLWLIWATQLINPLSPPLDQSDFLVLSRSLTMQQPKSEFIYIVFCHAAEEYYQRPELCEDYTQIGLKYYPQSWALAMNQGYVYGFLLNDKAKAAAYYQLAGSKPGAPGYANALAERFLSGASISQEEYATTLEILRHITGNPLIGRKHQEGPPP